MSPLYAAEKRGHTEVIKKILEHEKTIEYFGKDITDKLLFFHTELAKKQNQNSLRYKVMEKCYQSTLHGNDLQKSKQLMSLTANLLDVTSTILRGRNRTRDEKKKL